MNKRNLKYILSIVLVSAGFLLLTISVFNVADCYYTTEYLLFEYRLCEEAVLSETITQFDIYLLIVGSTLLVLGMGMYLIVNKHTHSQLLRSDVAKL